MQLNLFEPTSPSSSPLSGQHIRLDRTCRCGSNIAVIGPPRRMHAARLSCASCGAFVGWLPQATARWLINVVTRFGAPPSFKMVRAGQDIGNAPSDKHRQGLRLRVRLAGDKGVAREFSSTAATLWNAVDRLHDEFEHNRGRHSGKLPYVHLAKLEQVRTLLGVVFSPTFEIISWVVRPAELTPAVPEVANPADVNVELDPEEEEVPI